MNYLVLLNTIYSAMLNYYEVIMALLIINWVTQTLSLEVDKPKTKYFLFIGFGLFFLIWKKGRKNQNFITNA